MSPDPLVVIRPLDDHDVSRAMELVTAANWNQTPRDWRRMIDYQPGGCFKASLNESLVGTVTTTCYGSHLAWIGMMLVDASQRRRGIGTRLMQHVIDFLHAKGVRSIKLDATPAGQPLYAQLGFRSEHDFQRRLRPASAIATASATTLQHESADPSESYSEFDVEAIATLDRCAFGVDRRAWLKRLALDSRVVFHGHGFGMLRSGRIADYLGPVIAPDARCADAIIRELLSGTSEQVIWDVPHGNSAATTLAEKYHFEPVRILTRMWLGEELQPASADSQFAICDPATG